MDRIQPADIGRTFVIMPVRLRGGVRKADLAGEAFWTFPYRPGRSGADTWGRYYKKVIG